MTPTPKPGVILYDVTNLPDQTGLALFTERANAERFIADQWRPERFRIRERVLDEGPARFTNRNTT